MRPNGDLSLFGNNIKTNDPAVPFTSPITIGSGFHKFDIIRVADINGDGFSDLVGRKPDGTLVYYGNSYHVNPLRPFDPAGPGLSIGTAFHIFDRITLGDVSGDGFADLVGRLPDGTMRYYGNSYNSNPAHPFGGFVPVGTGGFQVYDTVLLADLNNQGRANLICRKPEGTLWCYLNQSATSPDSPFPATPSFELGNGGFQVYDVIVMADLDGDGYADILGRKPDGTLWRWMNGGESGPFFADPPDKIGSYFDVFSKIA
jgi:hypothetical protein